MLSRGETSTTMSKKPVCWGPASVGLRVPEGWMAQAMNEGSDTKFDAGERPALVGLTELKEFNQALFLQGFVI